MTANLFIAMHTNGPSNMNKIDVKAKNVRAAQSRRASVIGVHSPRHHWNLNVTFVRCCDRKTTVRRFGLSLALGEMCQNHDLILNSS